MSFTTGPCPECGKQTMYSDREPTRCPDCFQRAVLDVRAVIASHANRQAKNGGNRKQRRAAKSNRGPL